MGKLIKFPDYWTIEKAAESISKTVPELEQLVKEKKIYAKKLKGITYIDMVSVMKYLVGR